MPLTTSVIVRVYHGPLEEFVSRRAALAKELRASGDRESAQAIRTLRKPSRIAWALNLGAVEGTGALERLVGAAAETADAQAGGGDARAAIARLREAVRDFAAHAADAADQAGHRVEPAVLATAVLAVLGRSDSFDQLRSGRLAEVPDAGGLDFLATLPPPSVPDRVAPAAGTSKRTAPARPEDQDAASREASTREAARQAARALAEARRLSDRAASALRDAESRLQAAEERARKAQDELRSARECHEQARHEANAAASRLQEAESRR